ncbi:sodium channel protein para-like isoform X3 [Daktulosphaira vitifoliae]|uniref:sodium channel protein para-like isoform X3 n=1 Tax=Daktulosphaira vitifoliae TaxID=58002 RepID=UPI0021AA5F4D|nr:sodium channel protein para-like isoform X3 [Daktulosphaira vitifoliae]
MYSSEELLDAGIIYKNKKEQLDVTIGDGMELLIRGNKDKKKKPQSSSSYNSSGMHHSSTDENCQIRDKYEYESRSTKSYGSHDHDPYDSESHKKSKRSLHSTDDKIYLKVEPIQTDLREENIENYELAGQEIIEEEMYKEQDPGEVVEDVFEEEEYPEDCFPPNCYKKFPFLAGDDDMPFWLGWAQLRLKTFQLIENKYFETAVITMILLSSLALALEDVNLQHRPVLQDILYYMDRIFTVIFFLEMLIKWLALGFRNYFTNAWCWLDFIIVMVSLINFVAALLGASGIQAFKTMRTLRALRPLRAMARMQGMRVVVNALVQAIPSIFNVLLVCLIFWLIFAIMGVQLFSGKYYKCVDADGNTLSHEIIPDKNVCLAENYTWRNSKMNFDHVGNAYLCLFQVATFNGWMEIMRDAVDSRDSYDKQPIREINNYMYFYFVFFIIFGSFFTLNLFIGVIIDNFNEQKKKTGASLEMFMTEDQKKYYNAMKKMSSKKPLKAIPRPRWRPQSIVFQIVTDKKFDMLIMLFIGLNMLIMTLDHYHQPKEFTNILDLLNQIFIVIFSGECLLKIFALRYYYFKEPWNLFDFVVVILSLAGLILSDFISKYFVSPTLLRVVRVAKVGRVLRLVKGAKASNGGLDEDYNFRTFGQSMILLFMLSTSSGWDAVLDGITNEDNCIKPNLEMGITGSCGNKTVGTAFLLSYLVINFLIVINMYIAVILENYSQATEDVQEGLTDDDYDMYYEIWQHFDPDGTRYIRYDQLTDFLDILEPPLKIHKPNKYKIVSMDIPICKGDLIYCVDILDALTKDFFARKGNPIIETVAEISEIQTRPEEAKYEPISSTLWRMREVYCAMTIQKAWLRFIREKRQKQNLDETASPDGRDTAVMVESDGFVTKNGHKVVIHSRSSSKSSKLADV